MLLLDLSRCSSELFFKLFLQANYKLYGFIVWECDRFEKINKYTYHTNNYEWKIHGLTCLLGIISKSRQFKTPRYSTPHLSITLFYIFYVISPMKIRSDKDWQEESEG